MPWLATSGRPVSPRAPARRNFPPRRPPARRPRPGRERASSHKNGPNPVAASCGPRSAARWSRHVQCHGAGAEHGGRLAHLLHGAVVA
eukprot:1197769-Pyramimonas_sp.AAC.1